MGEIAGRSGNLAIEGENAEQARSPLNRHLR